MSSYDEMLAANKKKQAKGEGADPIISPADQQSFNDGYDGKAARKKIASSPDLKLKPGVTGPSGS